MDLREIIVIIGISIVVVLLAFLVYRTFKKKPKKEDKIEDFKMIKDFFGNNNILNVEQRQKRVRIEVKDLSKVDLEGLKPYTNGIFTTGNRVVATFKGEPKQIVKTLEGK